MKINGWVTKNWVVIVAGVAVASAWGTVQAQVAQNTRDISELAGVITEQAVTAKEIEAIKLRLGAIDANLAAVRSASRTDQAEILEAIRELERDTR